MRGVGSRQNKACTAPLLKAILEQDFDVSRKDEVDLIKIVLVKIGDRRGIARASLDVHGAPHPSKTIIVGFVIGHLLSPPL